MNTLIKHKLLPALPDPIYAVELATKIKTYPENLLMLYETCGLDYSLMDDEKELLAYCTVTASSDPKWYLIIIYFLFLSLTLHSNLM
jgi:hypothetical protein